MEEILPVCVFSIYFLCWQKYTFSTCFSSDSEWWRWQWGLVSVSAKMDEGQGSGRKLERDSVGEMEPQKNTDRHKRSKMKGDKRDWWRRVMLTEILFSKHKRHWRQSRRIWHSMQNRNWTEQQKSTKKNIGKLETDCSNIWVDLKYSISTIDVSQQKEKLLWDWTILWCGAM